jgi:hypothetical protein
MGENTATRRCDLCGYSHHAPCNSCPGAAQIALPPKGCICPPTSEMTCQRIDCGRKSGFPFSAARA